MSTESRPSSWSVSIWPFFKDYANECSKNFLKKNSKVLDIASNDGSFLQFFDKNKIKVGIDPAKNIVSKIKLNDLFLENNFF